MRILGLLLLILIIVSYIYYSAWLLLKVNVLLYDINKAIFTRRTLYILFFSRSKICILFTFNFHNDCIILCNVNSWIYFNSF